MTKTATHKAFILYHSGRFLSTVKWADVPFDGLVLYLNKSRKNERTVRMNNKEFIFDDFVRLSVREALQTVHEQIEIDCFSSDDYSFAFDIARIITEVYRFHPDSYIKIAGQNRKVSDVQEVYADLKNEHIQTVMENFKSQKKNIFKKKAYLQTALYNVVFEYEAMVANELRDV